jgi:hypothetical protein
MTGPASITAAMLLSLACAASAAAQDAAHPVKQQSSAHSAPANKAKVGKMTPAEIMSSAMAAAPREIAKNATILAPDSTGAMKELRAGTNGWTCMPDLPQTPGLDPMCLDEPGMQWVKSLMSKDPKPTNTAPGLVYMLQGGSDISATDPYQTTTDHFVESPPHYMILWPFDAAKTGLSAKPKKTGTWIMWAGTPYAHLMINQKP